MYGEGVNAYRFTNRRNVRPMVTYWEVLGARFEDADGGVSQIRSIPATVPYAAELDPPGFRSDTISDQGIVTSTQADGCRNAYETDYSEVWTGETWECAGHPGLQPGDVVTVTAFAEDQLVDVIGITKGKGFQGVVKRFRVAGGPATHGSMFHRRIGSVGMRQTPGRVWKNQAMPGHMGSEKRTVQNLRVVKVIADKNLILVKGAIPGANGDDVIVRSAIKGQPKKA
jgi:50S ribosomal protein uL3